MDDSYDPEKALEKLGLAMPSEIELDPVPDEEKTEELDLTPFLETPATGVFGKLPEVTVEVNGLISPKVSTPVGINPKDLIGATKVDPSVIPPSAILHLATAMMDGAVKYGPFNWRENPVLARVYLAAALRHTLQLLDGEDFDPTSNVHHAGHAMACLAIYLDAMETDNLSDNRPAVKGPASTLIRQFTTENKLCN
jgi:hypothetical protein